jgi:hypothetical protein
VYGLRRQNKPLMETFLARAASAFHPGDPCYDLPSFRSSADSAAADRSRRLMSANVALRISSQLPTSQSPELAHILPASGTSQKLSSLADVAWTAENLQPDATRADSSSNHRSRRSLSPPPRSPVKRPRVLSTLSTGPRDHSTRFGVVNLQASRLSPHARSNLPLQMTQQEQLRRRKQMNLVEDEGRGQQVQGHQLQGKPQYQVKSQAHSQPQRQLKQRLQEQEQQKIQRQDQRPCQEETKHQRKQEPHLEKQGEQQLKQQQMRPERQIRRIFRHRQQQQNDEEEQEQQQLPSQRQEQQQQEPLMLQEDERRQLEQQQQQQNLPQEESHRQRHCNAQQQLPQDGQTHCQPHPPVQRQHYLREVSLQHHAAPKLPMTQGIQGEMLPLHFKQQRSQKVSSQLHRIQLQEQQQPQALHALRHFQTDVERIHAANAANVFNRGNRSRASDADLMDKSRCAAGQLRCAVDESCRADDDSGPTANFFGHGQLLAPPAAEFETTQPVHVGGLEKSQATVQQEYKRSCQQHEKHKLSHGAPENSQRQSQPLESGRPASLPCAIPCTEWIDARQHGHIPVAPATCPSQAVSCAPGSTTDSIVNNIMDSAWNERGLSAWFTRDQATSIVRYAVQAARHVAQEEVAPVFAVLREQRMQIDMLQGTMDFHRNREQAP